MPQPNIIEIFSSCGHAIRKESCRFGSIVSHRNKVNLLVSDESNVSFLIGLEFITLWPKC